MKTRCSILNAPALLLALTAGAHAQSTTEWWKDFGIILRSYETDTAGGLLDTFRQASDFSPLTAGQLRLLTRSAVSELFLNHGSTNINAAPVAFADQAAYDQWMALYRHGIELTVGADPALIENRGVVNAGVVKAAAARLYAPARIMPTTDVVNVPPGPLAAGNDFVLASEGEAKNLFFFFSQRQFGAQIQEVNRAVPPTTASWTAAPWNEPIPGPNTQTAQWMEIAVEREYTFSLSNAATNNANNPPNQQFNQNVANLSIETLNANFYYPAHMLESIRTALQAAPYGNAGLLVDYPPDPNDPNRDVICWAVPKLNGGNLHQIPAGTPVPPVDEAGYDAWEYRVFIDVYFDTHDWQLLRNGLEYRLRMRHSSQESNNTFWDPTDRAYSYLTLQNSGQQGGEDLERNRLEVQSKFDRRFILTPALQILPFNGTASVPNLGTFAGTPVGDALTNEDLFIPDDGYSHVVTSRWILAEALVEATAPRGREIPELTRLVQTGVGPDPTTLNETVDNTDVRRNPLTNIARFLAGGAFNGQAFDPAPPGAPANYPPLAPVLNVLTEADPALRPQMWLHPSAFVVSARGRLSVLNAVRVPAGATAAPNGENMIVSFDVSQFYDPVEMIAFMRSRANNTNVPATAVRPKGVLVEFDVQLEDVLGPHTDPHSDNPDVNVAVKRQWQLAYQWDARQLSRIIRRILDNNNTLNLNPAGVRISDINGWADTADLVAERKTKYGHAIESIHPALDPLVPD